MYCIESTILNRECPFVLYFYERKPNTMNWQPFSVFQRVFIILHNFLTYSFLPYLSSLTYIPLCGEKNQYEKLKFRYWKCFFS